LLIPCANLSGAAQAEGQRRAQTSRQRPSAAAGRLAASALTVIVWHKDDQLDRPIFSVDARGSSSLREAKQQIGSQQLKGRAHLEAEDWSQPGSNPALVIEEARAQDGGLYTCTVEFYKAATQTHRVLVVLTSK